MLIFKKPVQLKSVLARIGDALRVLRGRAPKYSAIARNFVSDHQLAFLQSMHQPQGIHSSADIKLGTLSTDEASLFERIVKESRDKSGPIVQFGTLLGETAVVLCLWKSPGQKVFTIDRANSNPWNLSSADYRSLVNRLLKYLLKTGKIVHLSLRAGAFFKIHREAPALVFINFARTEKEVTQIIKWAQRVGAQTIAGRGYDLSTSHILRAVDEAGGPDAVEGNLWRLKLAERPAAATAEAPAACDSSEGQNVARGLVSIVIPVYNAREFIETTLEDVSRQLYRHWELIVVEDGSAEDVEATIEQFRIKHPTHRIVYRRKLTNCGPSNTRNEAFTLCRGKFVAFLDADDRWTPDHLQRKVRLLRETDNDLVYSRVEQFDHESGQALGNLGPTDEELQCFPDSMFRRPYLQPSGVVVRKSLLSEVGNFDEDLRYAEDYDYWLRAIKIGKQFCFDAKTTSRYRKNHTSAATTDRLVLCYDGVAQVASRHLAMLGTNGASERNIVAKHFLTAGAGHLAFPPSRRNGCSPEAGQRCLLQAWQLAEKRKLTRLAYYLLARLTVATRTTVLFRGFFLSKYQRNQI